LIVEDSPTQAEKLRLILELNGYDGEVAITGEAALACLAKSTFDMVISDIVMPGMSGHDLCRKIKAEEAWNDMPVILLTSQKDPMEIFRGLECGADNFYTKPYDADRLVERIGSIFHDRRLRANGRLRVGFEFVRMGRTFKIGLEKEQMIELLLSTFEDTVQINRDLEKRTHELAAAQTKIEEYAGILEGWVHRESSERELAEAALIRSEESFRYLFLNSPLPMWVINTITMEFLEVNDATIANYGYSREEFLAMRLVDIRPPEDIERLLAHFPASDADHVVSQHRHKDGRLMDVEIYHRDIEFGGEQARLALVIDVTARKQTENQLIQAQKMEAVGQLTGGVAHDFNNILMVIMANADALEETPKLDPFLLERIKEISGATQRASELTRQLLAFSRKQPLRPQLTNINDLVAVTGKLLRRTLGEQIEIESILADDIWNVEIDRAQLESVLVNLSINSRDAMPEGGRLLIETMNVELDREYAASNSGVAAGKYVMLAITDTGKGIPTDELDKVFEPFFTTKEVGKGTGLGLSMVYGFIKQSNGHIKIYSEVGRGTSMKLYLPRSEGIQEKAAPRQTLPTPGGSERIFVVEDDPQVRAGVLRQLHALGYAASEASGGTAALAAFEAAAPPYDLLLTDVIMPGPLNGRALADEVTRRWPKTKVVFMSGYTENAIIHHGQLDAGVLLLSKPFRKSDLAHIIRQALDGSGTPI
jgi:PAS domain S-box-containing protein